MLLSVHTSPNHPRLRVATIGAAFSANKGAASMLQAVLERLPERLGPCEVSILTTYPVSDAREELRGEGTLVSATPRQILFPLLPLAVLARVLQVLRLPRKWAAVTPAMKAIIDADIVLDLAGISFADGRSVPILGYNVLMTGIPLLAGAKVVKCSQALGPFRAPHNRLAARLVLPHLDGICARGPKTLAHLKDLGIDDAVEAADLAFLMDVPATAQDRAARLLGPFGTDFVAVAPSSVVRSYCASQGIDYTDLLVRFIDRLTEAGHDVLLFPHSYRETKTESRMNDGPLCKEIHQRLALPDATLLVEGSQPPSVLRAIVEKSQLLVTSRFHAMISGLATATPVTVVGWSHKYQEVMGTFGLEEFVIRYEDLSVEALEEATLKALEERDSISKRIGEVLPAVKASAERNFDVIERVVNQP
jgi:colanic acid/amylovoran biosynthesis protein